VLKDKDLQSMVSLIIPISDVIIVTKSANPRAADPQTLMKMIQGLNKDTNIFIEDSVPLAIDHAKRIAGQKDLICVTGSLFTVGEARSYVVQDTSYTGVG